MKKAIFSLVLLLTSVSQLLAQGYHRVNGYYRSNGTYVQPHYRTNPNHTINDNWSTAPNVNPFTGKVGTIAPENSYNQSTTRSTSTDILEPSRNTTNYSNSGSYPSTYSTPTYPTYSTPTRPSRSTYQIVEYGDKLYYVKD